MIRTTLSLAILAAIALSAFAAEPASTGKRLYMVAPMPILVKKAATPPGPVVAPAEMTISASALPDGIEGVNYNFDLKTITAVTGGTGTISDASFGLSGGALPAGLSLSNDGLLAGKPTTQTAPAGADFTVTGSYQTATGQQVYTIKVGKSVLHVTQISAGGDHSCAITTSGGVKCWGGGGAGQLGAGDTASSSVPVQVTGLTSGVSSISAGSGYTCAVVSGSALCWGYSRGAGDMVFSSVPVQVTGLTSGVSNIAAGNTHACAVVSGSARCWGWGSYGQLGAGNTADSSVPVQVTGLTSGVESIAVGYTHTCAVVSGSALCWGEGNSGQLGAGNKANSSVPVQVTGLTSGVRSISAGGVTCALVSQSPRGAEAKCWGSGQLGDGTTTNSSVPVQVTGLTPNVESISVGDSHVCLVDSRAAKCWGNNNSGQLGDGTKTNSSVPVQVTGLTSGVESIAVGYTHTCAVVSGSALCWGEGNSGQLGAGNTASSSTPVTVKAGN